MEKKVLVCVPYVKNNMDINSCITTQVYILVMSNIEFKTNEIFEIIKTNILEECDLTSRQKDHVWNFLYDIHRIKINNVITDICNNKLIIKIYGGATEQTVEDRFQQHIKDDSNEIDESYDKLEISNYKMNKTDIGSSGLKEDYGDVMKFYVNYKCE